MVGDQQDIEDRLRAALPRRWFGKAAIDSPKLGAALQGPAWALSYGYDLVRYAEAQVRLATATGGWLELWANDFLGTSYPRRAGEPDGQYRTRIRQEIFRRRQTRYAIDRAVYELTGAHPRIFEGWRPLDTGAWDIPIWGYDVAGGWGGDSAGVVLVEVGRLPVAGLPNNPGWDTYQAGFDWPVWFWDDDTPEGVSVTEFDVVDAINRVRAAGIRVWVRFTDLP